MEPDVDLIRDLMAIKMMEMDISQEDIEALDDLLCSLLGIENPDPLTFPP